MRKKLQITVAAALLCIWGYDVCTRKASIPHSTLFVHTYFANPRFWGNGVELDHIGWQEICYSPDGKTVKCDRLKVASPR
jgi:hypothetical protein